MVVCVVVGGSGVCSLLPILPQHVLPSSLPTLRGEMFPVSITAADTTTGGFFLRNIAYCDALDAADDAAAAADDGFAVIPCGLVISTFVSVFTSVFDCNAEKIVFLPPFSVTIGLHDIGENIPPSMDDAIRERPVIDLTDSGVRRSAAIFFSKTSCIRANNGPN